MPLVGTGNPLTLEDALTQNATDQTANTQAAYAQRKKKLLGQEAASGRLTSGVSDYDISGMNAAEGADLSGIQTDLASSLGSITSEDYLNQKNFARQQQLAQLIGRLNKPSTLDEVFGGVGAATNLGMTMAAFL